MKLFSSISRKLVAKKENKVALIISDDTLAKAQMSADELLVDLACYLYDKKRLSMGRARHLAELDQINFQKALAKRNIYLHYTAEDLNTDLRNLGIDL